MPEKRGIGVVRLREHFLRKISDAHAFGHDPDLLLAETLGRAVDLLREAGLNEPIDIVALASGVAPALIAAANDDRIRKLVLVDPEQINLSLDRREIASNPRFEATAIEFDLGIPCEHENGFDACNPTADLDLQIGRLGERTLLLSGPARRREAAYLYEALPGREVGRT